MNEKTGHDSPELTRIEERLRTERPAATGLELDQLKLRALSQARRPAPANRTKGQLMKSRFALLLMMVLGLTMSTTGATLAISGSSGSGSAGVAQYLDGDDQDILGDTEEEGTNPQDTLGGEEPSGQDDNGTAPDVQEVKQVAASDDGESSLPFTGFLAIPLLIGGVALLGSGAMLRWKARE